MGAARVPLDSFKIVSRGVGTYTTPGEAVPRISENRYFGRPWRGPGGVSEGSQEGSRPIAPQLVILAKRLYLFQPPWSYLD